MGDNYTFFDESAKKWKVVYKGVALASLYESEAEAASHLSQVNLLTGDTPLTGNFLKG